MRVSSSSSLAALRGALSFARGADPVRVEPFGRAGRTSKAIATTGRNRRTRQRALLAIAAAGISALVLLLGGILSGSPKGNLLSGSVARATSSSADQNALGRLLDGFSGGDTAGYVRKLERRIAAHPKDADALTLLGLAYQQRARETGDPTYYRLSGDALRRSSAAGGRQALIVQGRATLANTRHQFRAGLKLARRAMELDPENGSAYGALGDALLNLGRYGKAFRAYNTMAVLAPGIASYTRVASARELLGRPGAAAEAVRLAPDADRSDVPEHVAWATVQLGNFAFNTGRLGEAAKAYRDALRILPGYVHAEAGLARVEASEGHMRKAIARLRHVVEVLPIPAYVILLGDVFRAAGNARDARREYALVAAIERLFAANGVRTELQTAVFDLDHDRNVSDALRRARKAYVSAPGIYAEDALAWGLFRTGRCEEARTHSERALRLGTRDALLVFHRGMIERCLGHASARSWFRRALAINPHFSLLWAPVARAAVTAAS